MIISRTPFRVSFSAGEPTTLHGIAPMVERCWQRQSISIVILAAVICLPF